MPHQQNVSKVAINCGFRVLSVIVVHIKMCLFCERTPGAPAHCTGMITKRRQVMARANPKIDNAFNDIEPVFDGRSIRLPFYKNYVCPETFVSFLGDCGHDKTQLLVGQIITFAPMGQFKVNLFCAPVPDDNLGPINHSYLIGTTEVY